MKRRKLEHPHQIIKSGAYVLASKTLSFSLDTKIRHPLEVGIWYGLPLPRYEDRNKLYEET
jgi:hypothetical protein